MEEAVKSINKIIKKFGLHPDDAYIDKVKKFKIIRRRGYKKIQRHLELKLSLNLLAAGVDYAYVKVSAFDKNDTYLGETIGEASPLNNTFPYPAAVAQKRGEGRMILERAELYEEGFLAEDEVDQMVQAQKIAKARENQAQSATDATAKQLGIG